MADEVALGFLGDVRDPCWFFYRSNLKHSGNRASLAQAFQVFLVEGSSLPAGYYGERLNDKKLVAGKALIRWSDE